METGLKHTSSLVVGDDHLAARVGSGDLEVLATPAMLALMENAAMLAVADALAEGETTVGGQINALHLKPTAKGHAVTATAELTKVEGRKLTFKVTAHDESGLIGEGEHLRFVVDSKRFMEKLKS